MSLSRQRVSESRFIDETTLRRRLPLSAVLGLRPGPDLDWPRLWMLQHRELARLMKARIAAHGAGALLVAFMFFDDLPIQMWCLWLTRLGVSLYIYTRRDAHMVPSVQNL